MDDKRELLLQCDLSELGSKDAKLLFMLGVLGTKELIEALCAIVGKMENKLEQQAKEPRPSGQERAEQNAKVEAMANQMEQQTKELRAKEQEQAKLQAEICAMEKRLEQQAEELRASEQERAKLKAEIGAMVKQLEQTKKLCAIEQERAEQYAKLIEQQAKYLPLDELCNVLKSQVPIKLLDLSGENLNTKNFVV